MTFLLNSALKAHLNRRVAMRLSAAAAAAVFLSVTSASLPPAAAVEPAAETAQGPQAELPFSRRARLEPKRSGPVTSISAGANMESREAFENLAAVAGIQVFFHPQFKGAPLPPEFTLNVANVVDALDLLSRQTGNFWEVYDNRTILVAPNLPAARQRVETQALMALSVPVPPGGSKLVQIAAALKERIPSPVAMATAANAVLIRTAADNAALARQIVSEMSGAAGDSVPSTLPVLTDLAGNVWGLDSGRVRRVVSASHIQLQPRAGAWTFRTRGRTREVFETLAERAGFQIVFHRQFANSVDPVAFAVEDVDIFTALDLLSFQTGNFWQVSDPRTIIVATDNPTVRRDVEPMFLKTFDLRNVAAAQLLTESVTALRTLLSMNLITGSTRLNALTLRDTADKVALTERVLAALDNPMAGAAAPFAPTIGSAIPTGLFAQPADMDTRRAVRAKLQVRSTAPLSLRMNEPSRKAFESLAELAGIQVIFHRQFANVAAFSFSVENADFFTALDTLSFQTGNFWQVYDAHSIIVATDNPTVRRDVEPYFLKTISLKNAVKPQEVTEIVTALRTLLSFDRIPSNERLAVIVLRDTAEKITLAERIVATLDKPAGGRSPSLDTAVSAIPSGIFAQPADMDTRRAMRSQLQVKSTVPLSVRMNEPSRKAFETLAELAGVHIVFHRQFANQAAFAFRMEGVDIFTALDILAFQTGNFWQVYDPHTIIVATDNPTVRRDVEPMFLKTFFLRNVATQPEAAEIVTTLRSILNLNQIAMSTQAGALQVRDTADKIALAEKIVQALDAPVAGASEGPPVPVRPAVWSGTFGNPMDRDVRRARVVSQLRVKSMAPLTLRMNQPSRQSFESLADLVGISVVFHPKFANNAAFSFAVENVDFATALDILSFQTGNFWQVADDKTILVATDNPTIRQEVEPRLTRSINLAHLVTQQGISEVWTALRTLVGIKDISMGLPLEIVLTDTPDKLAIAERIVEDLDVPGRTQP